MDVSFPPHTISALTVTIMSAIHDLNTEMNNDIILRNVPPLDAISVTLVRNIEEKLHHGK